MCVECLYVHMCIYVHICGVFVCVYMPMSLSCCSQVTRNYNDLQEILKGHW